MDKILGLAELFFYPFYVIPAFIAMLIQQKSFGNIDSEDLAKLFNPMDGLLG